MKANSVDYDKEDIQIVNAFLKPALQTQQLSGDSFKSIIQSLKNIITNNNKGNSPELMTIKQACQFLKISKPTFYSLVRKKKMGIHKIGRSSRILKSDILNLLKINEEKDENTN